MTALRLGILGGTFNPIHDGHLLLAETAREALRLDRVLFIPAGRPPHKPARGLLPGGARMALVRCAIRGQAAFAASDMELRRRGRSYTIDTVRALRRRFPQATLFLLLGADLLEVPWRAWEELQRLCTVAVAARSGGRIVRRAGLVTLPMPVVAISSSDIRQRLATHRSIRYLVPEAVERAIRRHGWYGASRTSP